MLLGAALTHTGFKIYEARANLLTPRVLIACLGSALFSLLSTAAAVKALGLSAAWGKALLPRSVTSSLALPMAEALEAPVACTGERGPSDRPHRLMCVLVTHRTRASSSARDLR